jgi:hypothetical protein
MQKTNLGSSVLGTNVRRILLLYGGLFGISSTFLYLSGSSEFYRFLPIDSFLSWTWAASLGALLEFVWRLHAPQRKYFFYRHLYVAPALVQLGQDITRYFVFRSINRLHSIELILYLLFALDISLVILAVSLLRSAYKEQITRVSTAPTELEGLFVTFK